MKTTAQLRHEASKAMVTTTKGKATNNPLQLKGPEEEPLQKKQNPLQLKGLEEEEPLQMKQNPLQLAAPEEELQMKQNPLQLAAPEEELLQKKQNPLQLAAPEEELLQKKQNPLQLAAPEEELLQKKQNPLQLAAPEEELLQKKQNPLQLKGPEEEEPLQMKHNGATNPFQLITGLPIQKKENKTGMPDQLKSGIESLSGYAMDDVKVHYNSSQPAQLNALAYAQGTDIHVAPGQEKHLPHEAWHVVQQMQGRVQPTMQMKEGVAINDDKGLENEADVMGEKSALQRKVAVSTLATGNSAQLKVAQLVRKEKTLTSAEAKTEWLKYTPPSFTVTAKYKDDHVIDTVSKSTAEEASVERFKNDGKPDKAPGTWNNMTWTEATETKIKNKADGAPATNRSTNVYAAKQQLTTKLKNIKSRTVTPVKVENKERERYAGYKTFKKENGEDVYVSFNVGAEVSNEINGVGKWDPKAGTAEIYHYGAWPAEETMQDPYLKWVYDDDTIQGPSLVTKV